MKFHTLSVFDVQPPWASYFDLVDVAGTIDDVVAGRRYGLVFSSRQVKR